MPVRKTIDSLNLFNEEFKIICDDTLKMELNCVTLLCGKSEMGKSFLALKACANALNENYKPFFGAWRIGIILFWIESRISIVFIPLR